jgi:hypothetical protein
MSKIETLANFLKCDVAELSETSYSENIFEREDGSEYMVLTDSEADEAWNESLDNYIEECVLPELPEAYRYYFDYDAYKRDAKFDGRGDTLASYDSAEEEMKDNETGKWLFIYRMN